MGQADSNAHTGTKLFGIFAIIGLCLGAVWLFHSHRVKRQRLVFSLVVQDHVGDLKDLVIASPELAKCTTPEEKLTPLHYAQSGEVVRALLLAGANIDAKDVYGQTALHLAAACGNTEVVRTLIEEGANPNAKDMHGETPLYRVAGYRMSNKTQLASLLLEGGSDIIARDDTETTPLHVAAASCDGETLQVFLRAASDFNVRDILGRTPLHYAINNFNLEGAATLCERKKEVDVNAQDSDGKTPLHYAVAQRPDEALCKLLLNSGAMPDVADKDGKTPYDLAISESVRAMLRAKISELSEDSPGSTEGEGEDR